MMYRRVAPVKSISVHHYKADYIYWSFGIIGFILRYFENRLLLKPVLGGVVSVALGTDLLYDDLVYKYKKIMGRTDFPD